MLVLAWLGAPVVDVVSEVPLSKEFFDLILECDAFFNGVANILMISAILILVSLRAVSQHRVGSFVDSCVLGGQEYILTRPHQVCEVIVFARRRSGDPLIRALGLLLVSIRRSSAISILALLIIPVLISGLGLSRWDDLSGHFCQS